MRQFLTGLWQAFSDAFGKIRAILEPAVRALMQAYGTLYKAIFSVLEIFGLAASSADASSYRSLGETLGTVLGVIAKVGAYLLKFVIYNLAAVITVVAWVVRASSGSARPSSPPSSRREVRLQVLSAGPAFGRGVRMAAGGFHGLAGAHR